MNGERNIGNVGNDDNVISWGMLPNILGNVLKHSGECHQTFWGMSPNILGNVTKHSEKCPETFQGMSSNIPVNIANHCGEFILFINLFTLFKVDTILVVSNKNQQAN